MITSQDSCTKPQGGALAAPGRICVAIPAYNEEKVIHSVLQGLLAKGYHVVVVDDGSKDETYRICRELPVDVLRHPINMGYGAAQQTGIQWAIKQGFDVIVTFDADGQHVVEEIPKLTGPILSGEVEVAVGSRFLEARPEAMPLVKRLILKMAVIFTRWTTGLKMTDAHNGMRAFSRRAALTMNLTQNGMAYSSELVNWLAKSGFRWKEVPVCVRYTEYSMRKGQSIWNLFNILWEILLG